MYNCNKQTTVSPRSCSLNNINFKNMKKIFILMFLLALTVQVSAKESPYRIELKMLYPQTTDSWNYSDDSLDVSFSIAKGAYTYNIWSNLQFVLRNKTSNRVYIEWENARLLDQKPAFGSDTRLTVKNKKEDESVAAESNSIPRILLIEDFYGGFETSTYTSPWNPYSLKKTGKFVFDFLLPVRFEDGKIKDIKFKLLMSWNNISDISKIKAGMKSKEVKQAIGSPEYKEKIEKGHEIWHYTNNADITIIDEKVQAIKIVK